MRQRFLIAPPGTTDPAAPHGKYGRGTAAGLGLDHLCGQRAQRSLDLAWIAEQALHAELRCEPVLACRAAEHDIVIVDQDAQCLDGQFDAPGADHESRYGPREDGDGEWLGHAGQGVEQLIYPRGQL